MDAHKEPILTAEDAWRWMLCYKQAVLFITVIPTVILLVTNQWTKIQAFTTGAGEFALWKAKKKNCEKIDAYPSSVLKWQSFSSRCYNGGWVSGISTPTQTILSLQHCMYKYICDAFLIIRIKTLVNQICHLGKFNFFNNKQYFLQFMLIIVHFGQRLCSHICLCGTLHIWGKTAILIKIIIVPH